PAPARVGEGELPGPAGGGQAARPGELLVKLPPAPRGRRRRRHCVSGAHAGFPGAGGGVARAGPGPRRRLHAPGLP
ncbi:unnamed protein product, partial [Prorocentrum cordatum]